MARPSGRRLRPDACREVSAGSALTELTRLGTMPGMGNPPAPHPDPDRPPPWWRHRRRQFYIVTTAALLGLLVGGAVAWYRTDFPMPTLPRKPVAGIDFEPVSHWLWMRSADLQWWKAGHKTRELDLAGTTWIITDPERGGLTIQFGTDGRLSVSLLPVPAGAKKPNMLLSPYSSRLGMTPRSEVEAFAARLNGSRYLIDRESPWPGRQTWLNRDAVPNLLLLDAPEQGFFSVWSGDSRKMTLYLQSTEPALPPLLPTAHLSFQQVYLP